MVKANETYTSLIERTKSIVTEIAELRPRRTAAAFRQDTRETRSRLIESLRGYLLHFHTDRADIIDRFNAMRAEPARPTVDAARPSTSPR